MWSWHITVCRSEGMGMDFQTLLPDTRFRV